MPGLPYRLTSDYQLSLTRVKLGMSRNQDGVWTCVWEVLLKFSFRLKVNDRTKVGNRSGGGRFFHLLSSLCTFAKFIFCGSEGLSSLRLRRTSQLPLMLLSLLFSVRMYIHSFPLCGLDQATISDIPPYYPRLETPPTFICKPG